MTTHVDFKDYRDALLERIEETRQELKKLATEVRRVKSSVPTSPKVINKQLEKVQRTEADMTTWAWSFTDIMDEITRMAGKKPSRRHAMRRKG